MGTKGMKVVVGALFLVGLMTIPAGLTYAQAQNLKLGFS